jgi:hypothetical protein
VDRVTVVLARLEFPFKPKVFFNRNSNKNLEKSQVRMTEAEYEEWSKLKFLYYIYASTWSWMTQWRTFGTNVYDHNWDLLIILDGCRLDLMQEVANEYDFISEVDSIISTGSITTEWLSRTFTTQRIQDVRETKFICSNPHTDTVFRQQSILTNSLPVDIPFPSPNTVSPDDFEVLDEVWKRGYNNEVGGHPPRQVTDAAIRAGREDYNRIIAHYMQPHEPFIAPDAPVHGERFDEKNVWSAYDHGKVEKKTVWNAYAANLRYVLDDIGVLLNNIEATDVVITSDHGNAMGEWGFSGHPLGWLQPAVRRVPWIETTATDEETHTPAPPKQDTQNNIANQLEALGYL